MTRAQYVQQVATAAEISHTEAKRIIEKVEGVIFDAVKANDDVPMGKIGKIGGKDKAARTGRNPVTGEAIQIPAKSGQPYAKFSSTIKA